MFTMLVLSALAGAALLTISARLLPDPWDGVGGSLALLVASGGPLLLGERDPAQAVYAGLGSLFLTMMFRSLHDFVQASSDAKVREIVRTNPRRVPSL